MDRIFIFLILFNVSTTTAWSQSRNTKPSPARAYYEQTDQGLIILAENRAYCPYTVSVKLEIKNMQSSQGDYFEVVVPGQTERMELAVLEIIDPGKKSSFSMGATYLLGNAIHSPNHNGIYRLPYQKGSTFLMSQGFDGAFSHKGKNALDFTMKTGTQVCAAREGIVSEVIDKYSNGCNDPSCLYEANTITIYHKDGTFADYAHLKKNGSAVRPGDQVLAGQVIGFSGNTGYSSGPHLHFEVYYFDHENKISIPIMFDLGGKNPVFLEEKTKYTAH
jgi:murein DD-endopeptidase MepM/ murein hydrolase activator NlpD